jgi:hypothetical protein
LSPISDAFQTSNANIAVSLIAVLVNPWSGTRKRMVEYAESTKG